MPSSNLEQFLQSEQTNARFTSRTYNDFITELLRYASDKYSSVNTDFSESSFGGMLLDFAAIVGDSLMFYAEQQFNELNYENAVDIDSINQHLRKAGIKNVDASPSSVEVTFEIEVEVDSLLTDVSKANSYFPKIAQLPVLKSGNTLLSNNIPFILAEDVDFSKNYKVEIGQTDANQIPTTLFISKKGLCISGLITSETVSFNNTNDNLFLSYKLENKNVTKIISVLDEDLNEYYNVDFLTQTTVFKKQKTFDNEYIKILPAMRRFIVEKSVIDNSTILRFGNGNGKILKDNAFLNPEELFLPIQHTNYVNRVDLDPATLLTSNTLGVSPAGKTLTITYKHMGGSNHNVAAGEVNSFLANPADRIILFPNDINNDVNDSKKLEIIESMSLTNEYPAIGGSEPIDINVLKTQIPQALKMQSRIITYEDLIARILTMPSDFGRIHKAVALKNPYTSSSKDIYVLCKNGDGHYVHASDAIKENLSAYLNEYRLVGDNYNILDSPVYNFGIKLKLSVQESTDLNLLSTKISKDITNSMRFDLLNIGEPINVNLMLQVVRNALKGKNIYIITPESEVIVSKNEKDNTFNPLFGVTNEYNKSNFNPSREFSKGLIYPPRGGIFELKFSSNDIEILFN